MPEENKKLSVQNSSIKAAEKTPDNIIGAKKWDQVRQILRTKIGKTKFERWLAPLSFGAWEEGCIILHAPTKFLANWINDNYGSHLKQCWRSVALIEGIEIIRVDIMHQSNMGDVSLNSNSHTAALPHITSIAPTASVETPFNLKMNFENFVCGESNLLAYKNALAYANRYDGLFSSNNDLAEGKTNEIDCHGNYKDEVLAPLFICGGIGQGKTHLLHALGSQLKKNKHCRVMNLSAERFRYYFVKALGQKEMLAFKQRFSEVDVLLMDDLQFLSGEATQNEFVQILNLIQDNRGQLIVASTKPPSQLEKLDERIRSRLNGGLVVDINPADYKLRQDIIRAKLRNQIPPISFSPMMIQFLAQNITANVRELEGALNRIIAHARHLGKVPDIDAARLILRDLLQTTTQQITVQTIQKKTAEYYDISLNDLLSARRQRAIVRPRQIAMFLAKQLTPRSLPDIGRRFGGRDHTTVLHALRRVEELCASNQKIGRDVENIKLMCQMHKKPLNDSSAGFVVGNKEVRKKPTEKIRFNNLFN